MGIGTSVWGWFVINLVHPMPEFKRSFFGFFQLAVPTILLVVGWKWLRYLGPGIEETRPDFNCPEVADSKAIAQSNIRYFIGHVEKNADNAFIKFPLVADSGRIEHIWAYVHSYREGNFNVSLANNPVFEGNQQGRRDVPLSEVEDWQIMLKDGRIKGAYSLIALFRNRDNRGLKLSPKMRQQKAQLIDAV